MCCVAQAQADVLLSRLHYCLPGWGAAEQRRHIPFEDIKGGYALRIAKRDI